MKISERIFSTIEDWQAAWKDRLRGWMASWLAFGIEVFMDVLGKSFAPKLKPFIDTLEATGEIPPELKPLLDEMKEPTGEAAGMLGTAAGYSLVGGAVGMITEQIFASTARLLASVFRETWMGIPMVIEGWKRGTITDEQLTNFLNYSGYPDEQQVVIKELASIRLDPDTITRLWLRDKPQWEKYWQDLKDQGWDEDRIEVAKELAKIIPPLSDMVRFADYSAFDPEVIEKWREFHDAPGWIKEPFALLGVFPPWDDKYWFSHWVQPGRFELSEMHRRGLIDDDTVKLAYRTMGYSSFWQDRLLDLVKAVPTRVDVRRWWDMRTIDEARLREIYHAQGYYGKDLDDYVLWTKVYVAFPDLIARWKNAWVTEDEVRSELTKLGMPDDRVTEMIETKKKAIEAEKVEEERNLTKSEIYTGVKKGIITREDGIELIEDLNYTRGQAEYILDIRVGALEGSPETLEEFKDLIQKYRKAIGMEAKPVTEELKVAAAEVVRLSKDLEAIKRLVETEKRGLVEEEVLPEAATAKLDELRVALHRAEAELAAAKTHYDSLVAQWRYGG